MSICHHLVSFFVEFPSTLSDAIDELMMVVGRELKPEVFLGCQLSNFGCC